MRGIYRKHEKLTALKICHAEAVPKHLRSEISANLKSVRRFFAVFRMTVKT